MSTILGYMSDFFDAVFGSTGIGGKLITFITASGHEICLIPLIMWVLVALIGTIRKLLPSI